MEQIHNLQKDVNLVYLIESGDKLIFNSICDLKNDGNHGLPDWFFRGSYVSVTLFKNGVLDWTPGIGPAPCWIDKLLPEDTPETIADRLDLWFKDNYGDF